MNDKEFWMQIRRALLMMVTAIERKFKLGAHSKEEILDTGGQVSVSYLPDE